LHNPNISDETKQTAKERLDEMQPELEGHQKRAEADNLSEKNNGNVIGQFFVTYMRVTHYFR